MDIGMYLSAYNRQKNNAACRGIEFLLTFKEWCDFWGEDIERRGRGQNDLQMQRHADTGPYALGNIRKGTPKQNAITREGMSKKEAAESAAIDLQIALDAAMNTDSMPDFDKDGIDPHYHNMGIKSSYKHRYSFYG